MQKQQCMGKDQWLSNPTLVGGLYASVPGTIVPQKWSSSAYTRTLNNPEISQLNSPSNKR